MNSFSQAIGLRLTHEEQVRRILSDLEGKIFRRDWHGVADCAMDLRELEAQEAVRVRMQQQIDRLNQSR